MNNKSITIREHIRVLDFQTVCITIPKDETPAGRMFNVTSNEKALFRRNGTVIEQFSGRGKEVKPGTEVIVASLREYTLSIVFGAKSEYIKSSPDIEYKSITTITGEVIQSALVNITFAVNRDDKHNLHRLLEIPTQQTDKTTVKDIARALSNNVNISGKIYVAGYGNNDSHKSIRYDIPRQEQINRDIKSSVRDLLADWGILLRSVSLHIYSTSRDEELLVREADRQEQERILLKLKQDLERVRADNAKKSADYEYRKEKTQAEVDIEKLDGLKRKIQLEQILTEYEYAEKIAEIQAKLGKIKVEPPPGPIINEGTVVEEPVDQKIRKLTEQIRLDPNDVEACKSLGDAYCEKGKYRNAIVYYHKAINLDSKYTAAYKARGDTYYKQGQYSDAINDYSKASSLDPSIQLPNYADAHKARGDAYYKQGNKYSNAISDYTKVIELDPNYADAYKARGDAYYQQSKYSNAKSDYRKARGLDPSIELPHTVYVGSRDNYLYALDADTGALKWRYKTGNKVESSPAVYNGTVYVGSRDNYLYALDADTGALKWRYKTGNKVESSPSVYNGIVYAGSRDNYLYALDADTGSLRWRYKTGNGIRSSPVVAEFE